MKNIRIVLPENFLFLVKFSAYLNRHVFVMARASMVSFICSSSLLLSVPRESSA